MGLTLAVAEMPRGAAGRYDPGSRTVTIADVLIGEDPRVVRGLASLNRRVSRQRLGRVPKLPVNKSGTRPRPGEAGVPTWRAGRLKRRDGAEA
jgi:hypothetical protein